MYTQFAHDLCAARRRAGLSQRDLAVLLDIGNKGVAALEKGAVPPTVEQLCRLSIIYSRSFSDLYQELTQQARHDLFRNLPDLPERGEDESTTSNRDNTLKRLEKELTAAITKRHAGA